VKVTDPDGQVWRVSRRWVPWRRKIKDVPDPSFDLPDLDLGDDLGCLPAIGVVLFGILVLPFLVLAVLVAAEFALILLVLPFAVLGRVLFGRKWHVELRRGWRPWTEVKAGRWTDATLSIHQLADAVRRGEVPARTL
jgi:hypothetical protein